MRTRITPNRDTFYAVLVNFIVDKITLILNNVIKNRLISCPTHFVKLILLKLVLIRTNNTLSTAYLKRVTTRNTKILPLFIRGKLGTSKLNCGHKI